MGDRIGTTNTQPVTLSSTATSNNLELAIAATVGVLGIQHEAAIAAVVGRRVEVSVLPGLVNVSLWFKSR